MKPTPRAVTERSEPLARAGSGVIVSREERRHPRHRVELAASLATLDAERDTATGDRYYVMATGRTLDVGDGGVALQIDDGIVEAGRRVMVEVQFLDGQRIERNARVAWAAQDPSGANFIGLSFELPVPGLAAKGQ